jgi:hypothetical protein
VINEGFSGACCQIQHINVLLVVHAEHSKFCACSNGQRLRCFSTVRTQCMQLLAAAVRMYLALFTALNGSAAACLERLAASCYLAVSWTVLHFPSSLLSSLLACDAALHALLTRCLQNPSVVGQQFLCEQSCSGMCAICCLAWPRVSCLALSVTTA